jgi:hypothetical protein
MLTETTVGLIGEYVTAASLLQMGWRVSLAAQDKVDLVCWSEREFLRVQVKSATLKPKSKSTYGYQFQLASGTNKKILPTVDDYDMLACCSINDRRVVFYATEQVQQYSKRFTQRYFENRNIEEDSFNKAIEIIRGRI